MDKELIVRLHGNFEGMAREFPDTGTECWCARDLQNLLGYAQWKNFAKVIDKAITACEKAGYDPKDHFAAIRKMVDLGSGAQRGIDDIALTRYACYLIAQNGDPSKEQIAFAQTYFAVQTRKQEVIDQASYSNGCAMARASVESGAKGIERFLAGKPQGR